MVEASVRGARTARWTPAASAASAGRGFATTSGGSRRRAHFEGQRERRPAGCALPVNFDGALNREQTRSTRCSAARHAYSPYRRGARRASRREVHGATRLDQDEAAQSLAPRASSARDERRRSARARRGLNAPALEGVTVARLDPRRRRALARWAANAATQHRPPPGVGEDGQPRTVPARAASAATGGGGVADAAQLARGVQPPRRQQHDRRERRRRRRARNGAEGGRDGERARRDASVPRR